MKIRATIVMATLLLACSAQAAAKSPMAAKRCPVTTSSEIEGQFARFDAAWKSLNPDAATALFTAEPVLLPTLSNRPRTTPADVKDYFVGFFRNKPVATIDTSTIEIDCTTASRLGTWTVTLTNPDTGVVGSVKARYSFIYRFENGGWKIDHLHSSAMPER